VDLDGLLTPGCEASCSGATCTLPDAGTVTFTAVPLGETGLVFDALASSGAYGNGVQTSAGFTNFGILGEPTPPAIGAVEQTSAAYRHIGGFSAALRKP